MKKRGGDEHGLVYSTEKGRICRECEEPIGSCRCQELRQSAPRGDGTVRVRRETKGRNGKTVTTVAGLALLPLELAQLAAELKKVCSAGGTVDGGVIVIQGDHREIVMTALEARGLKPKLAGG